MKEKGILKKCLWLMLVILISFLMIWKYQTVAENIRNYLEPSSGYYASLFRETLKEVAVLLPIWLLSLLGLARSFLGENWFPVAEKIPVRLTKLVLAMAVILLIGVSVAGAVYPEYTEDSYQIQRVMETRFERWETVIEWTLFYGILLYIEQWCIQKNCSWKDIRKKQAWTTVTLFIMWLIRFELECVDLWYIPLSRVDDPNAVEDYLLWWFSLYLAVFCLPLWFFSARKTIRLFKNNPQWMTLSMIIPKKVTALIALASTGFMIAQIRESRYWNEWAAIADVPEYGEAAATGHTVQALMWGLALIYMSCLLVKQMRSSHRRKSEA